MTPPGNGLRDYLGYWLARLTDEVHRSFERKLAEHGVTVAQWRVLMTVYREHANSTSEVARFINTDVGAVSRLVDRLTAKGLMERSTQTNLRRRKGLVLTAAGNELVPELIDLADDTEAVFFGSLTTLQRSDLIQLLQDLLPSAAGPAENRPALPRPTGG
jgi:DNA-binding MarR family transcriptional regulator